MGAVVMDTREQVARLEAELRGGVASQRHHPAYTKLPPWWAIKDTPEQGDWVNAATPHDTHEGRWKWVRLLQQAHPNSQWELTDTEAALFVPTLKYVAGALADQRDYICMGEAANCELAVTAAVEAIAKQRSERDA